MKPRYLKALTGLHATVDVSRVADGVGSARFLLLGAGVEIVALLCSIALLHPALGLTRSACAATGLCWHVPPPPPQGGGADNLTAAAAAQGVSWYAFGGGKAVGIVANGLVGDALLLNGIMPVHLISRFVLARFRPTQGLMDEAARVRDTYFVPWRLLHLCKVGAGRWRGSPRGQMPSACASTTPTHARQPHASVTH